ncbi:hypothetical protein L211DRAFT_849602 [Terfezia boudieri ATCC MYA-4762]|uniref:Uncharacterized protein n=1 Tax=Terfezia boudieri ATCC MYA-4762 TaxID=1051890 RepID=A0A3N4LSJ0_9PEZI|nr:hypothetical protein L211DRAFT_849602 [Terfezia boudieri ATCC MYA-4762]
MQLKSVHSRHRSYVVFECRQRILCLYQLDFQSKEEVAKKVEWLLHKDRFVCREEQREELNTGEQATEAIDFKYETAATTFHRLRNTWGLYDKKVRDLILANIKADLRTRIGGFDRKAETEASDPCALVEGESYISELQEELRNTMSVQNLAGLDAWSEETVSQCSMGIRETIRKMYENTEGSQREETPTDIDEPPEVDENRDWQESQVPY